MHRDHMCSRKGAISLRASGLCLSASLFGKDLSGLMVNIAKLWGWASFLISQMGLYKENLKFLSSYLAFLGSTASRAHSSFQNSIASKHFHITKT